jgi:hypothetical protein
MSTTQTINAILDAIETTLKANSTLIALLGNGTSSIEQRSHDMKLIAALQKSLLKTPALFINYQAGEKWTKQGMTFLRTIAFNVDVIVKDVAGIKARENTIHPIVDATYNALIDSQLGLSNPAPGPVVPREDKFLYEAFENGAPLEITAWRVGFETSIYWAP